MFTPTLTRRTFIQLSAAVTGLTLVGCIRPEGAPGSQAAAQTAPVKPVVTTTESGATLTVYDLQTIKIHSFTTPWEAVGNCTSIIEGPTQLIVIDTQFFVGYAQEFRAYIDTLNKPIARLLITHEHPDHWFGLAAAFADVEESHALADVKSAIEETGPGTLAFLQGTLGEMAPKEFLNVKQVLTPGVATIDGVKIETVEYRDAEAAVQAVFKLPDYGVLLAGDLIYAYGHYFLTTNFDNWTSILQGLEKEPGYQLIIPGHGLPSLPAVYEDGIDYLHTSKEAFAAATDAEDLRTRLLAAYPDRPGAGIMDIYLPRLYPA
jgi:glyoxylase-like metal-dependent hydrolase (beta-lactamase superfamily II)